MGTDSSADIPAVDMPRYVDTHVHFFDVEDARGARWAWTDLSMLPADDGTFRTRGHGMQLTRDLAALGLKRFTPPELMIAARRLTHGWSAVGAAAAGPQPAATSCSCAERASCAAACGASSWPSACAAS